MPGQFFGSVRVLPLQGEREVDGTEAFGEVVEMKEAHAFEVRLQVGFEFFGQDSDAVFGALAVADNDLIPLELYIFDAQSEAFHEPHSGAIEQAEHEADGPWWNGSQQPTDLFAGEDPRQPSGSEDLFATVAADRAFPAAVAELDR